MRREGPSGNNFKSINFEMSWLQTSNVSVAVMKLLSSLRDLAACSLQRRAGLEDVNLLKSCLFLFVLISCH